MPAVPIVDVYFVVTEKPRAMPRPKVTRTKGGVRVYMPSWLREQQWLIRSEAERHYTGGVIAEAPFSLMVDAFFAPPASTPKYQFGLIRKVSAPDVPGIGAIVCDALEGLIWKNDAQVTFIRVEKHYDWMARPPRWEIRVRTRV